MSDLVERVMAAMRAGPRKTQYSREEAEAKMRLEASVAINIVLEEAAAVAEDGTRHIAAPYTQAAIAGGIRAMKVKI